MTGRPTTRFASFLATCEPGRIVNANPPWGAYELSPGESDLPAGVAVANIGEAKVKRGELRLPIDAGEALQGKVVLKDADGKAVGRRKMAPLDIGEQKVSVDVRDGATGELTATVTTRDAAGNKIQVKRKVK